MPSMIDAGIVSSAICAVVEAVMSPHICEGASHADDLQASSKQPDTLYSQGALPCVGTAVRPPTMYVVCVGKTVVCGFIVATTWGPFPAAVTHSTTTRAR